jgi:membrane-bound lytic murein transglycosylase
MTANRAGPRPAAGGSASARQRSDRRRRKSKRANQQCHSVQTLEVFQPLIAIQGERNSAHRHSLYQKLLDTIAAHHVADRPDRFEPRQRKRRQKKYDRMMKPRHEIKRDILKGLR